MAAAAVHLAASGSPAAHCGAHTYRIASPVSDRGGRLYAKTTEQLARSHLYVSRPRRCFSCGVCARRQFIAKRRVLLYWGLEQQQQRSFCHRPQRKGRRRAGPERPTGIVNRRTRFPRRRRAACRCARRTRHRQRCLQTRSAMGRQPFCGACALSPVDSDALQSTTGAL